ncbi:HAD-IB family hydrolase [Streptomyces sp. BBFR51]|uniref:HAD-IB family hydrolase n=1 Tax=Streptomyces sp. BBFR51 TaxID=3372856 RepID=UPI0037DC3433
MTAPSQAPAARRPAYLVFSDVDETLIDCKSLFDFLRFHLVRRHGSRGERRYLQVRRMLHDAAAAGADRAELNRTYYRYAFAGQSATEVYRSGRAWFDARRAEPGFFIGSTLGELRRHQACGATVVLVSGSFAPCVDPIAEHVGAARVLCTTPVIAQGLYTGEVARTMIGEGKRSAALRVLGEHPDVDPQECYAYGDHASDIPLLDCVGRPRAVGDAPHLGAYLARRAM